MTKHHPHTRKDHTYPNKSNVFVVSVCEIEIDKGVRKRVRKGGGGVERREVRREGRK